MTDFADTLFQIPTKREEEEKKEAKVEEKKEETSEKDPVRAIFDNYSFEVPQQFASLSLSLSLSLYSPLPL